LEWSKQVPLAFRKKVNAAVLYWIVNWLPPLCVW